METTTTVAPARPTADDVTALQALQQFELAARDLFRAWSDELGPAAAPADGQDYDGLPGLVARVAANHDQWSSSVGGLLGVSAPQTADQAVVDEWQPQFDAAADKAAVALEFETAALAALFELAGSLQSTDAVNLVVAMARVAGEHCVAFADANGQGNDLDVMLGTTGASA